MTPRNIESQIIIYQTKNEDRKIDVLYKDDTFWLTQKAMSELFNVQIPAINKHLSNIFAEGELSPSATISKMEIVQKEGERNVARALDFYNLDAIIAVGYRVNSKEATQFRIWATNVLREYIIKGFALNDEMLKNGRPFGKDHFRELLERVRSIRASERRIWQQITDIFAECSIDYEKDSSIAHNFYSMVQNKFHYAITGQTAAEIIYSSANHKKDHMGLTTWKNSPDGRILKSDTEVAKNYLNEKEIRRLERTVTGFFDYIEDLIEREHTFTMEDFSRSIDAFLSFRQYKILSSKGTISRKTALQKAHHEYDKFNETQKINSDFDQFIKKLNKNSPDHN